MKILKIAGNPYISLIFNILYAVGNCALGFIEPSWWFITVGAYYTVLATTRFYILKIKRKKQDDNIAFFVKRVTGVLLVLLSFCIVGVNVLSVITEQGRAFHEIIMITIATYTFTKITVAIIGMIKAKHTSSSFEKTLRNISLSDACVSIYTMQRSMLVTFDGMTAGDMRLLNILTGTAVWIVALLLGINLIGGKKIDMAKSKIVEANEKIAKAVVGRYKNIEKGVVGGYKKIEKGVTEGYAKIEDKFIEAYLTKENETLEDAKKRLKNETK